jgi:DNA-directed RNA polymerase subunit omega
MARVTVEDCIRHYPNRFEMVLLAARRGRQLLRGAESVSEQEHHKPVVQALKEIGEGKVSWEMLFELEEQERRRLISSEAMEQEETR